MNKLDSKYRFKYQYRAEMISIGPVNGKVALSKARNKENQLTM